MFRPPGGILYPDGPAATETGRSTPPENRKLLCSTHSGVTCLSPSRRVYPGAREAYETFEPRGHALNWRGPHPAELRTDEETSRSLERDPPSGSDREVGHLPGLCGGRIGCSQTPGPPRP